MVSGKGEQVLEIEQGEDMEITAYALREQRGLDTVEANFVLGLPEDTREAPA